MTSTLQKPEITYPENTVKRAERALICSPFNLSLFAAMRSNSIPLGTVATSENYTQRPLSEAKVESQFMWLIQVGLLRREVDGQGITDSFRLTPLGRQLTEKWEKQLGSFPKPSLWERLSNTITRWLNHFQ